MNNYDDKIIAIKNAQTELLKLVKNKIETESNTFNISTKSIIDVLNYDDKMVKKYEAVVEAQKLIEKYTNELKLATTVDEITEIRKKINSSINKIKKEMKNRGIDENEYNNYCQNANNLRKIIAANIRYLKRESKIKEIEELNSNISDLSLEDKDKLKKLVKNELAYGKRNINKYIATEEDKLDEKDDVISDELSKKAFINKDKQEENKIDVKKAVIGKDFLLNQINSFAQENNSRRFKTYDSLHDFIGDQVEDFKLRYKVDSTLDYTNNPVKNLVIFAKNLPKIIGNKAKVRPMIFDYNIYFRKSELIGYSEYVRENSSILYNLKKAFGISSLNDKEYFYLNEHEKCINWIIEFCDKNNLAISYRKA